MFKWEEWGSDRWSSRCNSFRVVIFNPRNLNLFKSTSLHRTEEWLARGTRGRLEGNGPTGHHSDTALHLMKMLAGRSRPGRARGALLAWPRWERLANTRWPTQKIPETRYDVLRIRIAPYRFGSLTLPDGTRIIRGAPIGELHCNNDSPLAFVRLHGTPYPAARDDLRCLARWFIGFELRGRCGRLLWPYAHRAGCGQAWLQPARAASFASLRIRTLLHDGPASIIRARRTSPR